MNPDSGVFAIVCYRSKKALVIKSHTISISKEVWIKKIKSKRILNSPSKILKEIGQDVLDHGEDSIKLMDFHYMPQCTDKELAKAHKDKENLYKGIGYKIYGAKPKEKKKKNGKLSENKTGEGPSPEIGS